MHADKFVEHRLLDFGALAHRRSETHGKDINLVVVRHAADARLHGGGDKQLLRLHFFQMAADFGGVGRAVGIEHGVKPRHDGVRIQADRHGDVEAVDDVAPENVVALDGLAQQQAVGERHGFARHIADVRVGADLHHQRGKQIDVHHPPAQMADFDVVAHRILLVHRPQQAAGKAHNQLFGCQHGSGGQRHHRQGETLNLRRPNQKQPEHRRQKSHIAADHHQTAFFFDGKLGMLAKTQPQPHQPSAHHRRQQQQRINPLRRQRDAVQQ